MRLLSIRVAGFRGFNALTEFSFSPAITLVYGANGTGKTSLGEALEWLLYGATSRQLRGEEYSKREYAGAYRNLHYDNTAGVPFVEAQLSRGANDIVTVRRELVDGDTSQLYVGETPAEDSRALGLASEHERPMILQHTLQDFIHQKPKERYRALSSLLGLESLIVFRNHVDRLLGPAGYEAQRPKHVDDALQRIRELHARAAKLGDVCAAITPALDPETVTPEALTTTLREAINDELGAETTEEEYVPALERRISEEQRGVLDWAGLELPSLSEHALVDAHDAALEHRNAVRELLKAIEARAQDEDVARRRAARGFLKAGVDLREEGAEDLCPFCGQRTLTDERMAEIEAQLEMQDTDDDDTPELLAQARELAAEAPNLGSEIRGVLLHVPDNDQLQRVRQLMGHTCGESVSRLEGAAASARACNVGLTVLDQKLSKSLQDLTARVNRTLVQDGTSSETAQLLEEISAELAKAVDYIHAYRAAYEELDAHVRGLLSSGEKVQCLALLRDAWNAVDSARLSCLDRTVRKSLQDFRKHVRSYIEQKQEEILSIKGEQILQWYSMLNPGEPVAFSGIKTATDSLQIMARSFDAEMQAAPNLSCSHLNCLGLAVYLACAVDPERPFKYLLIDDPIQSMDGMHEARFTNDVLGELLARDYQVILLTHLQTVADSIDRRYRARTVVDHYEFTDYSVLGPTIRDAGPQLTELVREANEAVKRPNRTYHLACLLALRKGVECFVRDLYVSQTGCQPGNKYRRAQWRKLRELLRHCPALEAGDEARLEQIHGFLSSYCHTDETVPSRWPSARELQPHVLEFTEIVEKYSRPLGLDRHR